MLGADSTSTYGAPGAPHYFNNAQKLFEIGEESTLGVVTWGLGGLNAHSHRTLLAVLADSLKAKPPKTIEEVSERWAAQFWTVYTDPASPLAEHIARCKELAAKPENERTPEEKKELFEKSGSLVVGFCVAGYLPADRSAQAFEILIDPLKDHPTRTSIAMGWRFWGAPNMIQRLIFGCDDGIKEAIMTSGKWQGTRPELDALIGNHALNHPIVPIRDAIDFVHACISSTIKAFKFSSMSQICGGPIEIAVITTDRRFRWVRHKTWDAAILEGDSHVAQ